MQLYGDATLVNSGELLEENDKQNIINTIENAKASTNTTETNTISEDSSIKTNAKSHFRTRNYQNQSNKKCYYDSRKFNLYQRICQ